MDPIGYLGVNEGLLLTEVGLTLGSRTRKTLNSSNLSGKELELSNSIDLS